MEFPDEIFQEIVEGKTKLLVPKKSITDKVPPMKPAFFNPKAKLNRDFSIIAYSAFLNKFQNPKIFLEGLSGIGARGLRVSNELKIESFNKRISEIEEKIATLEAKKAIKKTRKSLRLPKREEK